VSFSSIYWNEGIWFWHHELFFGCVCNNKFIICGEGSLVFNGEGGLSNLLQRCGFTKIVKVLTLEVIAMDLMLKNLP